MIGELLAVLPWAAFLVWILALTGREHRAERRAKHAAFLLMTKTPPRRDHGRGHDPRRHP